jgi:RNA polymerase sigma factor (sigma-70 family)
MDTPDLQTTSMHQLVDRLRAGDRAAENELLRRIEHRLDRLCRKMLHQYALVRQAEETGDVMQQALLRLLASLRELRPAATRDFFNLAGEHIRRTLLDLTKHYRAQRRLPEGGPPARLTPASEESSAGHDPSLHPPSCDELEQWQRLHEAIAQLPAVEREVVGLLYYQGWAQAEVAELLQIDERTVRRKWIKACLMIKDRLGHGVPEF